ncbi:MAG: thioredoxin-disulfide reductase [Dethiobacteria bacterium]|jgi:thioredoxin reductase (NADPH)
MSPEKNRKNIYDLIILGAGPAGVTAAIYGSRSGLDVLLLEHMITGGVIASTEYLENYPGFPEGISGQEFCQRLERQAMRFGAEIINATVESTDIEGELKKVSSSAGVFWGRSLLVATGTMPRGLGVAGEGSFLGKGISFCAICDGPFFRDKTVAVIGGGDAAVEGAQYLTRFAARVILIHRRNQLRAVPVLQKKILKNPKVKVLWDTVVREFRGEQKLNTIIVENVKDNVTSELAVDGAFLYIGRVPNTGFLRGLDIDSQGYIITNEEMETSVPGVFAAGDVRRKFLCQVVTAASDGAIAAMMALKHLKVTGAHR